MEKLFHLAENGTTVRREINAGITTFFAMAYIIFVNPVFLSAAGMDPAGVMIATCLGAALGSALCALISNMPYAMAPGMGLNTFFAFTLCGPAMYAYSWRQALALTFIAGGIFLLITLTPLRDRIIAAVPVNLRHAIAAGIGLFIALIGMLNAGLIVMTDGFPALGDLRSPQAMLTLFGLLVTAVLLVLKVKAPLLLGMAATVAAGVISGQVQPPEELVSLPGALSGVFLQMDFRGLSRGPDGGRKRRSSAPDRPGVDSRRPGHRSGSGVRHLHGDHLCRIGRRRLRRRPHGAHLRGHCLRLSPCDFLFPAGGAVHRRGGGSGPDRGGHVSDGGRAKGGFFHSR